MEESPSLHSTLEEKSLLALLDLDPLGTVLRNCTIPAPKCRYLKKFRIVPVLHFFLDLELKPTEKRVGAKE